MTLKVFQCGSCGTTVFPSRYLCPVCGGGDWTEQVVREGTVAEQTTVRHRVGADNARDICLASIRTGAGPVVIARLEFALEAGTTVRLEMDDENRILASAS